MEKEKLYTINGSQYLNPYIAICQCCDKTFKTEAAAFNHVNKVGHDVYFCKSVDEY